MFVSVHVYMYCTCYILYVGMYKKKTVKIINTSVKCKTLLHFFCLCVFQCAPTLNEYIQYLSYTQDLFKCCCILRLVN